MTLIVDTKETDIMQRLKDLEQFVLNLEQARLKEWTIRKRMEKQIAELQHDLGNMIIKQ